VQEDNDQGHANIDFPVVAGNTNHRFPKYPTHQKIIQPKTQINFAENREIRRTLGAGEKKEVTVNTPSKKLRLPLECLGRSHNERVT
jgi:hypothetical protein